MKHIKIDNGFIVIAPIGSEDGLIGYLCGADLEVLETFNSPSRRAEWVSWRAIVRKELGDNVRISYDSVGAPVLENTCGDIKYISVSHTKSCVAVLFSTSRCGVDIEVVDRNFDRVSSRYISHNEDILASGIEGDFKAVMWCAKEALYKFGRCSGVNLLEDIAITSIDSQEQTLEAMIFSTATPKIHYRRYENQILCYVAE